jgi:predicted alpha/beta-fold hydrolase
LTAEALAQRPLCFAEMPAFDFPGFRARAPWWGADLQTLRNTLAPPPVDLAPFPAQRLWLPLDDGSGDTLLALRQGPSDAPPRPLVVLVHGLGGCEDSVYMQRSAQHLLARGYPVVRLNLRGAGPSRRLCGSQYHAGRSEDFAAALAALDPAWLREGLMAVGYSLGANLLLKFLAEHGKRFPVRAAAAISAPIELARASRRIMQRRNAVYHAHLLRRMRHEALGAGVAPPPPDAEVIRAARSIYEFDDRVVAARGGFTSADDYYRRSSAAGYLDAIEIPTLILHARDDPWIPAACFEERDWSRNPRIELLLAAGGGHVGFHASDAEAAWHDRCVAHFFSHH